METFGVLVVKSVMRVACKIIKNLEGMFSIGENKTLKKQTAKSLEEKGYLKILRIKEKAPNSRMINKIEVKLNVFEL